MLTNSQVGCFKMHNSSLKTLDNHIHNYLKPNERKIMGYKTEAALNIILNKGWEAVRNIKMPAYWEALGHCLQNHPRWLIWGFKGVHCKIIEHSRQLLLKTLFQGHVFEILEIEKWPPWGFIELARPGKRSIS